MNDCGCCEDVSAVVPAPVVNRPGMDQVHYRVGTHAEFLASALAALSDPEFAALRALTTRTPDDWTVALLDGWAALADVLTFYQERLANEVWLRTATERDSVGRLARLIGYRLKPGVAAETPLAFRLDETPGAPTRVAVEVGTKVQSVPGAGEKPQTFETVEPLDARVEWNALRPALTAPVSIGAGTTSLYLKGTATSLQPGDAILIVDGDSGQEHRDFRRLLAVTPDVANDRTRVTWEGALGGAIPDAEVYALRQRAALFGHNAPDPAFITKPGGDTVGTWANFFVADDHAELDNAYPKIVVGGWVAFVNTAGQVVVLQATGVSFPSRADFALSGKVTRIALDFTGQLKGFDLRETTVYAQSERLETTTGPLEAMQHDPLAGLPSDAGLLAPVEGASLALDRLIPPLPAGRKIIVTGKRLRVRATDPKGLTLTSADGSQKTAARGDSLMLLAHPSLQQWSLRTDEGFEGVVTLYGRGLSLSAARAEDETVSELVTVQDCVGDPSVLTLEDAGLTNFYDRSTVTVAANVADATHGETVAEILGGGDAARAHQKFVLKQTPLTYVRSASAPNGAASTLQVRVDGLLWHEVSTLYQRGPRERVFTTALADDGAVTVRFGDGTGGGARLPSGAQNVRATYRRGVGLDGLVDAGRLTTLLTRPPGLKSAVNPLPAEGADEPETLANARGNAPRTVLTLDRVVSLQDYEDYGRSFGGVTKALATWTWDGRTRGVLLTVAGARGAAVSAKLALDLTNAIHAAGDPFVPVRVVPHAAAAFRLSAQVGVAPDYESATVLAVVTDALRGAFSFDARAFGQPVALSEVIAVAQGASPGVVAVNVKTLYRGKNATLHNRLEAALPAADGANPAALVGAELLTLDPTVPPDLEAMTLVP